MNIDRDLLWKAWPKGCLPHWTGTHRTVGSYLYWGAENEHWSTNAAYIGSEGHAAVPMWGIVDPDTCEPLKRGHLLPNVDPSDIATWACVLQDLAVAASGLSMDKGVQTIWERRPWPHAGSCWSLTWQDYESFQGCMRFDFPDEVADPALAVVLARISLREKNHAA